MILVRKLRLHFIPQTRLFSGNRKGFIQNLLDNMKKEYESNKEIKDNIEKFRKSTKELEESEEFLKIRQLYKRMEQEIPTDASEKIISSYRNIMDKVQKETDQLKKTEILQKGLDNLSKAVDAFSNLKDTGFGKQAIKGVKVVEKELRTDRSKMYKAPDILKTRFELAGKSSTRKIIEANESVSGVVMHKDSSWLSTWSNFKDNNPYMQKIFDLKTQLDESDSLSARSTRYVTEKISGIYSSFVTKNEVQKVIEEIMKMDSSFTLESFIQFCQFEVIPNVLEAIVRGDTVILKDWCYEGAYNILTTPINEIKRLNYRLESKILDVHHLDVVTGSMMDQGPMLLISFESQQINVVTDVQGNVVEGNPEKCLRVRNHWALCRDQTELNPWAAWRLIDIAMTPNDQWF